jgi:hypothetical protein
MYNIGDIVLYKGVKAKIRQVLGNGIYLVEVVITGVLYVQIARDAELKPFTYEEEYERGM